MGGRAVECTGLEIRSRAHAARQVIDFMKRLIGWTGRKTGTPWHNTGHSEHTHGTGVLTLGAVILAIALPAHAALWEFSVGGYASAGGAIGLQTATYVFDLDELSYTTQCAPTWLCWPGTRTTTGSVSVTYTGLVAGTTTGTLQAAADNSPMDPWWQITTPGGGATGWVGDAPEWFAFPRTLGAEYFRLGPFPLLASGGDAGWSWLSQPGIPVQYLGGTYSLRPVPEPSMLVLLLAATVAMMGWLRGRR